MERACFCDLKFRKTLSSLWVSYLIVELGIGITNIHCRLASIRGIRAQFFCLEWVGSRITFNLCERDLVMGMIRLYMESGGIQYSVI